MIGNVALFSTVLWMALIFILLDQFKFIAHYKNYLWQHYSHYIAGYLLLLYFNLFGILFLLYRKFFFKDTGKKLQHLEKQFEAENQLLMTELDRNQ